MTYNKTLLQTASVKIINYYVQAISQSVAFTILYTSKYFF